jgi:CHAD domain-containing protein
MYGYRRDMSNEPYPEQDKLGPLGGAVLPARRFDDDADLRAAIVAAFRAAIADADTAVQIESIDEAIHELRKALRRARAIKSLVGATLAKDDRRDLRRALVETRKTLSTARDLTVLPHALEMVDESLRPRGAAVVELARTGAAPVEQVRETLAAAAARVTPLADMIAAALPAQLEWSDLEDGLAETYRRARDNLRTSKRSPAAFHRFRKRAKELSYQLELLADGIDGKVERLRRGLVELGDTLGDTVDVWLLREVAGTHAPDDADLLGALDEDLRDRIKLARRQAKAVFDRRARKFARKVRRAVRADHAPEAVPEPVASA